MIGTKLIWIVLLTFTFLVVILTTPILTFKSQDTTNNSGNATDSCREEFLGYCMNGRYFFYLEEKQSHVNVGSLRGEKM